MGLLGLAGDSASNPILAGLNIDNIFYTSSFDVASVVDTWVDSTPTVRVGSSVKSLLIPAATNVSTGIGTGSYTNSSKIYSLPGVTGLAPGSYIYLNHASITPNVFEVATNPSAGQVTFVEDPLTGADRTGISFQIAWTFSGVAGTAPLSSSTAGTQNYLKAQMNNSLGSSQDIVDSIWCRNAPPTANKFISLGGVDYTGGTVGLDLLTLDILPDWVNGSSVRTYGGLTHLKLAAHSVTGGNNFTWGDDTTGEKTIADAIASKIKIPGIDGLKRGRLLMSNKSDSVANGQLPGTFIGFDIQVTKDTSKPVLGIAFRGS
jgi:hypothetical protein